MQFVSFLVSKLAGDNSKIHYCSDGDIVEKRMLDVDLSSQIDQSRA